MDTCISIVLYVELMGQSPVRTSDIINGCYATSRRFELLNGILQGNLRDDLNRDRTKGSFVNKLLWFCYLS
jgi:hypothetical protein